MFGLMTVKRHDAIVAKADAVIDDAARHLRAEEFSAGRTLGQKVALAGHLKAIGDKHRRWIVSYAGYQMEVVATTAAKARYSK